MGLHLPCQARRIHARATSSHNSCRIFMTPSSPLLPSICRALGTWGARASEHNALSAATSLRSLSLSIRQSMVLSRGPESSFTCEVDFWDWHLEEVCRCLEERERKGSEMCNERSGDERRFNRTPKDLKEFHTSLNDASTISPFAPLLQKKRTFWCISSR